MAKFAAHCRLIGVALLGLCLGGCGASDTKADIVGTWQRKYEGKVVQEITFTPDGKYDSVNPATGAAKESGGYTVSGDGKSIDFNPGRVSYAWQIRFKGKNEFDCWQEKGGNVKKIKEFEYTYQRTK